MVVEGRGWRVKKGVSRFTRDPCCNRREALSYPLHFEMRPHSLAVTREEFPGAPLNLKGGLIPHRQHEWFPEVPEAT